MEISEDVLVSATRKKTRGALFRCSFRTHFFQQSVSLLLLCVCSIWYKEFFVCTARTCTMLLQFLLCGDKLGKEHLFISGLVILHTVVNCMLVILKLELLYFFMDNLI